MSITEGVVAAKIFAAPALLTPELVADVLKSTDAARAAIAGLAPAIKSQGALPVLSSTLVLDTVKGAFADEKATTPAALAAREAAAAAVEALAGLKLIQLEPFLLPLLPVILDRCPPEAKSEGVRKAGKAAASAIVAAVSPVAVAAGALPILLDALNVKRKWQTREASLGLIGELVAVVPDQIRASLAELVPKLSECCTDVRGEVSKAAQAALTLVAGCNGNPDIAAVIPQIISCVARPAETTETIHALSATTFVSAVEAPTLAVLTPLLQRGLMERAAPIKRKTAIIIENMTKLVHDQTHAQPLVPKLLPGLLKMREEVADPEVRAVANRAFTVLLSAAKMTEAEAASLSSAKKPAAASAAGGGASKAAPAKGGASKGAPAKAAASGPAEDPAYAAVLHSLVCAMEEAGIPVPSALEVPEPMTPGVSTPRPATPLAATPSGGAAATGGAGASPLSAAPPIRPVLSSSSLASLGLTRSGSNASLSSLASAGRPSTPVAVKPRGLLLTHLLANLKIATESETASVASGATSPSSGRATPTGDASESGRSTPVAFGSESPVRIVAATGGAGASETASVLTIETAEGGASTPRPEPTAASVIFSGGLDFIAGLLQPLQAAKTFDSLAPWRAVLTTYLGALIAPTTVADAAAEGAGEGAEAVKELESLISDDIAPAVFGRCFELATGKDRSECAALEADRLAGHLGGEGAGTEDPEDAARPDLCKCEFSLAYGGKILLNTAALHLKRGAKYGLCGPNGAGKSTLLRAIANGQLEGFPPKDVLRSVYVEPEIPPQHADLVVLDFAMLENTHAPIVAVAPVNAASGGAGESSASVGGGGAAAETTAPVVDTTKTLSIPRDEVAAALKAVGFTDSMLADPVTSLSGGWRMKLALTRAMLMKPDIYLLDEPTNHLSHGNVTWIVDFLKTLKDATVIVVSHDSTFLDNICSHIIHYEGFKLRTYRGNLSAFVKVKPEARSYYELSATAATWTLPEPKYLDGVKSKDKAIMKLVNVGFTYPGRDKAVLSKVCLAASLSSRVCVHGENGAGKSTLIKLITGELESTEGSVTKHPNLRIAYVAQHAFHHIEKHLTKTPSEYIQWRYAAGEDREALEKVTRKLNAEDEAAMAKVHTIGGVKLVVSRVLNRRKEGKGYVYEVEWVGQPADKNQWLSRSWLESVGCGKLVDAIDSREAAAAGLHSTPLTSANVAKHLENLGLDREFTLHHRMAGLSGGQKVKVVLGAALWQNPHLVILDEPTNFLDRDSLGAMSAALKDFGGGVILITHHGEFVRDLGAEIWKVADGGVATTGQSWEASALAGPSTTDTEVVDAAGNVIVVKAKLTGKAAKKASKEKAARRRERIKRGEDPDDTDDEDE